MPLRDRRHRLLRAAVWTAVSFVLGGTMIAVIGWPSREGIGSDETQRLAEVTIHVVFGLVSIVCLPFVLCCDGRTIPRESLRPKVLAAEKLREFLTTSGRGGVDFLNREGSVASLQRRTGGWLPIVLGLMGVACGTIGALGFAATSLLIISLCARRSWLLSLSALVVTIAAQIVGYVLTPNTLGDFDLPIFLVSSTVTSVFIVIGVIRGSREQGLIDSAAQTLLRGQSRQERAIAEVRGSIARDMHDSLSHHLSVIAMYSGALSVREDLDPDSVRQSARLIADSARRSGIELREVLTMLRGDDQGTVVDPELEPLVRSRSEVVELVYTPPLSAASLRGLGALERTTIYRFVQEAMTNAFKHAPGARLRITVAADEEPESLLLIASNPLRPLPSQARTPPSLPQKSPITGSGLGLLGLRERMEAMGGNFSVSTGPDFVLRARIPTPGLVAATPPTPTRRTEEPI